MKNSTGTKTSLADPAGEHGDQQKPDGRFVWRHLREAQETIKGENQLAEYVARLYISECARILAASPIELSSLATLRDECRVGPEEKRSFEEVIKVWTLYVLSRVEGS